MEEQVITKEMVSDVIKYIKTIPQKGFNQGQQTLEFNPKNIGKNHCFIGWIGVNPASPLYEEDKVCYERTTARSNSLAIRFNALSREVLGKKLHMINNNAPKGEVKTTLLEALKEMEEKL